MKTAGRENPNHGVAWPHNRAHGAVGQNRSYSIQWDAKQEKFQPKGMCFFLTSTFIERSREPLPSGFLENAVFVAKSLHASRLERSRPRGGRFACYAPHVMLQRNALNCGSRTCSFLSTAKPIVYRWVKRLNSHSH